MPEINNIENNVFQDTEELYDKPIKPIIPKKEIINDIDLDNNLYNNIIEAGKSSQIDIGSINSLAQKAQNRNDMYNIFDAMGEDGSIGAVLETYAEDSTETNDSGNIVWVESSDQHIAKMVEFLLDSLNVNKNIFKWCYSLCKYGDVYLRLYRNSEYNDFKLFENTEYEEEVSEELKGKQTLNEDIKIKAYSKKDGYAHYMEMVTNPATMFELTRFGKTIAYISAPVINTVTKNIDTTYNTFNFNYKFKKNDIFIYPPTEFVHAALEDDVLREDETVDIFLNDADFDNDENSLTYKVRRGQSLLANTYAIWRQLQLLESSVLLNRVTKSSIIRTIQVEVGDMPKENVSKTLLGIKQLIEQKAAIKVGQSMTDYTNPGPVENNIYVPTHNGKGAVTTAQIGGDVDVKSLADLEYYLNKLYGQLRVPKQYFNLTEDNTGFNGGTSLAIISSRYAKMIKRIQNTLIQAITDAINLMLIDKGLDSYVNQFTLHMLPPTTQEEIDRRDNISGKIQLVSDIMNMLGEIEDPQAKLRMLKSLLTNVLDNTEITEILQEQIDKLENEPESEEEVDEDEENIFGDELESTVGSSGSFESSGDLNTDFGSNLEPEEESIEDLEPILPTGEEMGVDLNNPEE